MMPAQTPTAQTPAGHTLADIYALAHVHALKPAHSTQSHLHHVGASHHALRRRLQHHRVARHEGRCELGDRQVHGVVEGGDGEDDA